MSITTVRIALNKRDQIIFSLIAFASILLAYLLYPQFLGDDTFIHIGFINDLAAGKGFSYTGTITYGTTSPMWVILGTIFTKLFFPPETAVRILSSFFSFVTVYLLYVVLVKNNVDKKITFAAIVSLALNPFFLRWALSGMEVSASMCLLLLIYILFDNENKNKWYLGGLVIGLAVLIRPEFFGFFIITLLYYFFVSPERRKDLITTAFIALMVMGVWILFAYNYFGTIIPNTYLSKASGDLFSFQFANSYRTIKLFVAGNPKDDSAKNVRNVT